MDKPRVSIIVPMLNVARYLPKALDSISRQTLRDIEVICVDGGSTDGTVEIVRTFCEKDCHFRLVKSPKKSYGAQMNIGLSLARGEYFGIVEPDDWIEPDMYAVLVSIADKNLLDFVKSDLIKFIGDGDIDKNCVKIEHLKNASLYWKVLDVVEYPDVILSSMLATCTAVYRMEFLKRLQFKYNESPGASYQDTSLYVTSFSAATRCMFIPRSFYHYRRDNINASSFRKDGALLVRKEYEYVWQHCLVNVSSDRIVFLRPWLLALQFAAEVFTYQRISPEERVGFWDGFRCDFKNAYKDLEFNLKIMPKGHQLLLRRIMEGEDSVGRLERLKVCLEENGIKNTFFKIFKIFCA